MRKVACETCQVRRQSVIRDLAVDEIDCFEACGSSALYRKRQVIFHEDTPANALYIVCSGAVKLYQSDRFGHEHILHVAAAGEIIGEIHSDPERRHSVSAEAITEAQLRYLPREALAVLLRRKPQVGIRLIEALSRTAAEARRQVRTLALKRAESRMADLLLRLTELDAAPDHEPAAGIRLSYSRRELGDMIGVAPETAIRLLSRLKRSKIVEVNGRELVITDRPRLLRLAQHDEVAAA
jgi:CRP-like cAMP-binding protein